MTLEVYGMYVYLRSDLAANGCPKVTMSGGITTTLHRKKGDD
jgi:hypothetical protein